jgi:hypothetical protein
MKKILLRLAALLAVAALASCAGTGFETGPVVGRPHVPGVTMPLDLNRNEQGLIGEVERVLEQNGLRPTDRREVEYQLAFSVEDGPVNADVTLDLYQGRNRVAHAYARVGGPRIVFQRQRVIREAFDKALQQFESQLPRTGGYQDSYREPGQYQGGRTVPYGSPDPYGQPPEQQPYGRPDWQSGY